MTITFGQIAGLIAALAFLILVVFICTVLKHLVTTVKEMNNSIQILTKDANSIAGNVDELLVKTNVLMEDVNHKVSELDPLFKTAAELSESVSDLNVASRSMADKVVQLRQVLHCASVKWHLAFTNDTNKSKVSKL